MTDFTAREQLQQYLQAPLAPQLIYVAVKLGIPDLLRVGAHSGADLAQQLQVHPPTLQRLLRGMVVIGLLTEAADGRFILTPLGSLLQPDHPDSLYDDALITGELFPAWCGLLQTLQTGRPAFNMVFGSGMFSYFAGRPVLEQAFNRQMAGMTTGIASAVVNAYDFSGISTLVDIGGGYGTLLSRILEHYPMLRGVLFDLPAVIASARERLAAYPTFARCTFVSGDFFAAVPTGGDIYVLQVVIHDWDDEAAVRILSNCARAMHARSRILLVERVLPERACDAPAIVQGDINMLVLTGGRERTFAEYKQLLATAGLELARVIPTASAWSVIEAKRAGSW